MTDTDDALNAARSELVRLLAERGWSYRRAAIRFDWQLGWDARRDANPPAAELLSEGQVRHLCELLKQNVMAL